MIKECVSKGPDEHYGLALPLLDMFSEDEFRIKKNMNLFNKLHYLNLKK